MSFEYQEVATVLLMFAAALAVGSVVAEWAATRTLTVHKAKPHTYVRLGRRTRLVAAALIGLFLALSMLNSFLVSLLTLIVTALGVLATQHRRLASGRASRAIYGAVLPGLILTFTIVNLKLVTGGLVNGLELEAWLIVPALLTSYALWKGTEMRRREPQFRTRRPGRGQYL